MKRYKILFMDPGGNIIDSKVLLLDDADVPTIHMAIAFGMKVLPQYEIEIPDSATEYELKEIN